MEHAPNADTRSPWYEAFAEDNATVISRWLPGTQFPAPADEAAATAVGGGAEASTDDQWATDALFDCYNG
jgi:hypothetical protein